MFILWLFYCICLFFPLVLGLDVDLIVSVPDITYLLFLHSFEFICPLSPGEKVKIVFQDGDHLGFFLKQFLLFWYTYRPDISAMAAIFVHWNLSGLTILVDSNLGNIPVKFDEIILRENEDLWFKANCWCRTTDNARRRTADGHWPITITQYEKEMYWKALLKCIRQASLWVLRRKHANCKDKWCLITYDQSEQNMFI